MTTEYEYQIPLTSEAELKHFIKIAFGVTIPDVQVCPEHSTPWRAFSEAYFARASTSVWKASRGFGGKTYLLGLLALAEAMTLKANATVLGGSGVQSQRVLEHIGKFVNYPNAPRQLVKSEIAREIRFAWGNTVESLMASTKSARGAHPQRLRMDEVDEMDLDILDAATGQPMSGDSGLATQTVLSSTHQYSGGTMDEVLRRAADKGWTVHQWCWRENLQPHGWLTPEEVERKRSDVTAAMWDNEYDLQEPNPQARAIMTESVRQMFKPELGTFNGEARQYIEIEEPDPSQEYATGADWAKSHDWTVIWTLRKGKVEIIKRDDGTEDKIKIPARFVAFERLGREPYPAMVARYDYQVKRFHSRGAHDGTGLGTVVDDLIESGGVTSVTLTGRIRADILSDYVGAIERGDIESPFITYAEAEHRLASRADLYQSADGYHLPDTICAGALTWYAANKLGRASVDFV